MFKNPAETRFIHSNAHVTNFKANRYLVGIQPIGDRPEFHKPSLRGKLDCVCYKIKQNLPKPKTVAPGKYWELRIHLRDQINGPQFCHRREHSSTIFNQLARNKECIFDVDPPGLNFREIQDISNLLEQDLA